MAAFIKLEQETKPSANPGKLGQRVILHKTNLHLLQVFVEIHNDCPDENKQNIFIQNLLYSKIVRCHQMDLAEN